MVLWIVPNEAIYTQTLKALRDRDHSYRQTLDRAAAGRVRILEKGDTLNRADLDANLCVMVLMLQSSNRENQESLRLFADRGDVHGFVPGEAEQDAHKALKEAVPNLSIYDLGDGGPAWPMVKSSMGNAMRVVRPVVVMDEGQRAVSDLAFRTLYDFNPAFVLELSATPKDVAARPARAGNPAIAGRSANILVEISGRELESEGDDQDAHEIDVRCTIRTGIPPCARHGIGWNRLRRRRAPIRAKAGAISARSCWFRLNARAQSNAMQVSIRCRRRARLVEIHWPG